MLRRDYGKANAATVKLRRLSPAHHVAPGHGNSATAGLRRRVAELIPSTVIFGLGGLAMSSTQVIALRLMSRDEVGRFVLIYGIASVGATVIGFGLPQLLARTASVDRAQLEWRRAVWIVATVLAIPGAALATLAAFAFPGFRQWGVSVILLLILLMITANLQTVESSYRRVSGYFKSGAAVQQGTLVVVTLVLLLPLLLSDHISALSALWIMLFAQIAVLIASAVSMNTANTKSVVGVVVWLRQRVPLLAGFWLASTVAIGFRWADRLVLAGVLSLHQLSEYQSLFILTSLYDLLAVAIGYINLPRYARSGTWAKSNLWLVFILGVGATLLTAVAAYALGGTLFLIHWTTATTTTFFLLVAVGVFKLWYAEVSAVAGALANGPDVLRFSTLGAVSLLVGVIATIACGSAWGMVGAAVGALGLWVLRVTVSYSYLVARIDFRTPAIQDA